MLRRIIYIITSLKYSFRFNFIIPADQRAFKKSLLSKPRHAQQHSEILLVPLMDDFGTMKIVLKMANFIAAKKKLTIKYFFVHAAIDQQDNADSILGRLLAVLNKWSALSLLRLRRTYNVRSEDVIMTNYFNQKKDDNATKFNSKNEVLTFRHNEVNIGELLYDTYLRFRTKPTVDVYDRELYTIKDYMAELTNKWDLLFEQYDVKTVLMPYMAYHHWGIPGKTALKKSVEVITFGSSQYILQNATLRYPYHSKNFAKYPAIFSSLDNQQQCLSEAEIILNNRLNGVIDSGISYMKTSAFSKELSEADVIEFPTHKKWAVIFLHCFFDSPHIYGDGLFADFYEWTTYLLDKALQNPHITYYVKSHPNGLPGNQQIVDAFRDRYAVYPNIVFLSKMVSNGVILDKKPGAIFTYYGTVAHEFSYKGVAAVTCGSNPHSYYDFVYNCQTLKELDYYLQNVGTYGLPPKYDKAEILNFFYMHYLYYSKKYSRINFQLQKNLESGAFDFPNGADIDNIIFD